MDKPKWRIETKYKIGDVVKYRYNEYVCTKNHKSTTKFNPKEYSKYWDLMLEYNKEENFVYTSREKTQKELK